MVPKYTKEDILAENKEDMVRLRDLLNDIYPPENPNYGMVGA